MTVRSEESMVPESVATWSLDLFLLPGLPFKMVARPALLGRRWFVTTCFLGPWDVRLS